MWISDLFKTSRTQRYFSLLGRQGAILTEAAEALSRFVDTGQDEFAAAVDRLELAGDEALRDLIAAIRDSFITPFDRQDLYYLGEGIDDMIDYLESAATECKLFELKATEPMRRMCAVLVEAAHSIRSAVGSIEHDPSAAYRYGLEASAAENRMEDLYRHALAELFNGDDYRTMLKTREIYRHLSNSADRADAVGRVIAKIVIKTT